MSDSPAPPGAAARPPLVPGSAPGTFPGISVVMPVRNEERHLADSVREVLSQDYPGEMELALAVGPSRDRTSEIAERIAAGDSRITVVPNPSGQIPSALNAAIKASRHSVVARVDGHCLLPPGYLRTAVRALEETGADNVGGVMARRATQGPTLTSASNKGINHGRSGMFFRLLQSVDVFRVP